MDFALTEEQRDLQRLCREFARNEIEPWVREHRDAEWAGTAEERFPRPVWEAADEVGLRVMHVPERYGGDDYAPGVLAQCLMFEELATADVSIVAALANGWKLPKLLQKFPQSVQEEWFPRLVDDPTFSMAQALTEPRGASDRWLGVNDPEATLDTTAERDGEEWVIDGTKQFITGGYHADLYFVYLNTDPSAGMFDGTSLVLVPREADGVEVVRENETVGHRLDANGEIRFDGARVPEEYLIFHDSALTEIGSVFTGFRTKTAAKLLGPGRAAFSAAVDYARDRVQGGSAIADHQMIQRRLADMAVALETARTAVWRAAAAWDAGDEAAARLGLIARIHAAEAAFAVAENAVEVHGGAGSMREQGVERYLRDAATGRHLFGTQDVQRLNLVEAVLERREPGTP